MPKHFPRQPAHFSGSMKELARQFRQEQTRAEACLWEVLRTLRLPGYKFRRQHPIGRFIVDFYCPKALLVIEVDGEIHNQQVEADQEREHILMNLGYRFLRFTNEQVLDQTESVLQKIKEAL